MLNPFGVGVALGTDRDPGKGLPNYVLIFCARGIRLGADLHRVRYLAASRFLSPVPPAKCCATSLATAALRSTRDYPSAEPNVPGALGCCGDEQFGLAVNRGFSAGLHRQQSDAARLLH